jgi:hypothetical protein
MDPSRSTSRDGIAPSCFPVITSEWQPSIVMARSEVGLTPRLVPLHTLAHGVMRELTLECGYSTASLRERGLERQVCRRGSSEYLRTQPVLLSGLRPTHVRSGSNERRRIAFVGRVRRMLPDARDVLRVLQPTWIGQRSWGRPTRPVCAISSVERRTGERFRDSVSAVFLEQLRIWR